MTKHEGIEQAGFSIGVVARMTNISVHTLRMWDRRYSLGPSKPRQGKHREYSSMDIDHLKLVKQLVDGGMKIGDIAKMPMKTLSSLLIQNGQNTQAPLPKVSTLVVGTTLCHHFSHHIKRYPALELTFERSHCEDYLTQSRSFDTTLLILQLNALNHKHLHLLQALSDSKKHILICYHYSNDAVVNKLTAAGIGLIKGGAENTGFDAAINKVLRLERRLSELERHSEAYALPIPAKQPPQFSEAHLLAAEQQASQLNCECPQHLTDLIRKLTAFEQYSKTCGAENWKQAATHACIYSYANQARFLMEKALIAALDE